MNAASPNRTPSLELGFGSETSHYVDICHVTFTEASCDCVKNFYSKLQLYHYTEPLWKASGDQGNRRHHQCYQLVSQYLCRSRGMRMEPPSLVVSETVENVSEMDGNVSETQGNVASKKYNTTLWQLAESGDLDRVKMALTAGAEVGK